MGIGEVILSITVVICTTLVILAYLLKDKL